MTPLAIRDHPRNREAQVGRADLRRSAQMKNIDALTTRAVLGNNRGEYQSWRASK
jgi:hypothetical protein